MKNKLIEEIKNGNLTMVNTLLANDANINYQDEDGDNALIVAAKWGHLAVVQVLLAQKKIDVNFANKDGDTALMCAVKNNHLAVVQVLLA